MQIASDGSGFMAMFYNGTEIAYMDTSGNLNINGAYNLVAGAGIGISGRTITNTGIRGIVAGAGISSSGGNDPTITNTGVRSLNGATGAVTGVTSLQGSAGALSLVAGTGIGISGLTITNSGIISLSAGSGIGISGTNPATIDNTGVLTLNGATGAVTGVTSLQGSAGALSLAAGTGIGISGLTITNTGVLSLNGATGAVTGVTSLQGSAGALSLAAGSGIGISGLTITNNGVLSLNGSTGAVTGVTSLQGSAGALSLTANSGISISGLAIGFSGTYNGALTLSNNPGGDYTYISLNNANTTAVIAFTVGNSLFFSTPGGTIYFGFGTVDIAASTASIISYGAANATSDARTKVDFGKYAGDYMAELMAIKTGQYSKALENGKIVDLKRVRASLDAATLPSTVKGMTKEGWHTIHMPDIDTWLVGVCQEMLKRIQALESR